MTQEYEALAAKLVRGIDDYSDVGIVATKAGLCRKSAAAIRALVADNERLREALLNLCEIMEHDLECPPCTGSDAPAEHWLGVGKSLIAGVPADSGDGPPWKALDAIVRRYSNGADASALRWIAQDALNKRPALRAHLIEDQADGEMGV